MEHRYTTTAGLVIVALAAALAGCDADDTGAVVVTNQPPAPELTITPASPSINDEATFDGLASTDPDGTIAEFRWDFEGDSIFEASGLGAIVTHSYATAGERTVTLRLLDDDGDSASVSRSLTVRDNLPPVAAFTYAPATPATGGTVTFDAAGDHAVRLQAVDDDAATAGATRTVSVTG